MKPTMIGSDNGLSPGRRQAIIWTNAGILLIGPLGTNFIEVLIGIQTFSFKKMHLNMSSAKYCQFRLGLNVLNHFYYSLNQILLPKIASCNQGLLDAILFVRWLWRLNTFLQGSDEDKENSKFL